jgi:hypothetical protein
MQRPSGEHENRRPADAHADTRTPRERSRMHLASNQPAILTADEPQHQRALSHATGSNARLAQQHRPRQLAKRRRLFPRDNRARALSFASRVRASLQAAPSPRLAGGLAARRPRSRSRVRDRANSAAAPPRLADLQRDDRARALSFATIAAAPPLPSLPACLPACLIAARQTRSRALARDRANSAAARPLLPLPAVRDLERRPRSPSSRRRRPRARAAGERADPSGERRLVAGEGAVLACCVLVGRATRRRCRARLFESPTRPLDTNKASARAVVKAPAGL